jgi:uncharacterized protein YqgC (DUF456 family)
VDRARVAAQGGHLGVDSYLPEHLEVAHSVSISAAHTTTLKVDVGDNLLWVLSAALILLGLAGTVLPALPGTLFVLAGIVLGAWIDDFTRVGWGIISAVGVLAVLAWVLDYVAGLLGARKAGASRQALIGAALGTVAGIFMGLVGVLFMPLVGAAVGEYLARRDHPNAIKVGVATWLGIMAGLVAKVVIAFMMIGLFVAALVL